MKNNLNQTGLEELNHEQLVNVSGGLTPLVNYVDLADVLIAFTYFLIAGSIAQKAENVLREPALYLNTSRI